MLDRRAATLIKPAVLRLAQWAIRAGLNANQLSVIGFCVGICAAVFVVNSAYLVAAVAILVSRIFDALDGAVARMTQPTDFGGFLDIALDFLFYASIPLAFAVNDPARNGLPAAVLLAAFIGTGSSFLAFSAIAAKRGMTSLDFPDKSIYFLGGLTEATETLLCFLAMCVYPERFIELAYGFSALCVITTATRIWWGWKTFT